MAANRINGIIKRLFVAALAAGFMLGAPQALHAAESELPAEFVTTVNLNLRSGPSIEYDRIQLLTAGTVITINRYEPDMGYGDYVFSAATFGGISGYVASRYIAPVGQAPALPTYSPATSTPISISINDIEKISWWTKRDSGVIPVGTTIQIFDVRTGLTYYVRNFSNGNHADVETLTQQDTDIMRQTSGGAFSWDARPVLATFNGRTFAAAIHTMPHAGYTLSGNGMNGHICLHFLDSTPHNGNRSWQAEMQTAVVQAFNSQ